MSKGNYQSSKSIEAFLARANDKLFRRTVANIADYTDQQVYDLVNAMSFMTDPDGNRIIPEYETDDVEETLLRQAYYNLKYTRMYCFEYSIMYRIVIGAMQKKKDIHVASMGAGAGQDYWGLTRAIELSRDNIRIHYYGYDIVDWKNKFDGREEDEYNLICGQDDGDALNYFRPKEDAESDDVKAEPEKMDVLVFPKSISEIYDCGVLFYINENIQKIDFKQPEIYVCASIRKNLELEDILEYRNDLNQVDYVAFKSVVNAFKIRGYELEEYVIPAGLNVLEITEVEKGIKFFEFPPENDKSKEMLIEIDEYCANFLRPKKNDTELDIFYKCNLTLKKIGDCAKQIAEDETEKENISCYPMSNPRNIKFAIAKLKKSE